MKRLHVNVGVADLDQSIRFYSVLFGAEPTVKHDDYAKWMLDDPRVNFAISTRGAPGIDHLGIQAENADELAEMATRLKAADQAVFEQTDAACCYARSDKAWVRDPSGLNWETFHTSGQITTYGGDTAKKVKQEAGPTKAATACCGPQMAAPVQVQAQQQQQSGGCGAKSCG